MSGLRRRLITAPMRLRFRASAVSLLALAGCAAVLVGCGPAAPLNDLPDVPVGTASSGALPDSVRTGALWGPAIHLDRAVLQTFGVRVSRVQRYDAHSASGGGQLESLLQALTGPYPSFEQITRAYAGALAPRGFEQDLSAMGWSIRGDTARIFFEDIAAFVRDDRQDDGSAERTVVVVAYSPWTTSGPGGQRSAQDAWYVAYLATGHVSAEHAARPQHAALLAALDAQTVRTATELSRRDLEDAYETALAALLAAGNADAIAAQIGRLSRGDGAAQTAVAQYTVVSDDGFNSPYARAPYTLGSYFAALYNAAHRRAELGWDDRATLHRLYARLDGVALPAAGPPVRRWGRTPVWRLVTRLLTQRPAEGLGTEAAQTLDELLLRLDEAGSPRFPDGRRYDGDAYRAFRSTMTTSIPDR